MKLAEIRAKVTLKQDDYGNCRCHKSTNMAKSVKSANRQGRPKWDEDDEEEDDDDDDYKSRKDVDYDNDDNEDKDDDDVNDDDDDDDYKGVS